MKQRRRSRPRRLDLHTRRLLNAQLALYRTLRTRRPIDSLLQTILDTAIAHVPGAQRGSVLVREGDRLIYRATNGYALEALRLVAFPLAGQSELYGDRIVSQVDDFVTWNEANLSPETNAILREHGHVDQIRRSLVSTIRVSEQFYGSLVLDNLRSYAPFPPEAETLARLFAEQAGVLLEQALLLEQLQQTNTQLIEAEKLGSLGRFIASIAHEINNPLTAVLGYAEFLGQAELDADARAMLEQLRFGAERVRTIVRNLQLFARQQQSGQQQVHLNLLTEQTLMLMRGDLTREQVELSTGLDGDLPYTWADGGQISQVLLNLLVNALHALQLRSPPRRLLVQTLFTGGATPQLLLRVADNGPGIDPTIQGRIFEPFFSTKPAGQGTGLGLSICQGIVQAHGGTLSVESAPGAGATFTVTLPLRVVPEAPGRSGMQGNSVAPVPTGLWVLLIDDDPTVLTVVLRSLEQRNRVDVASNGAEGLRLALANSYELILCDLRMPEVSGLELFRQLQAARPEQARRLLFISGDTSSAETRKSLIATGRPLLAKPFRPDELYAAIAALQL